MSDEDVVKRASTYRERGLEYCMPYWRRARENHDFARGQEGQWLKGDLDRLKQLGLPHVSISQIPLILRSLCGRQILSRFERQYVPRTPRHAAWAEAMTLIDRALMDRCDAWQEESALFRNAAGVQGVGWSRMRLDRVEDPRGKIVIEHVPIWNMLWPQGCEKANLVDRAWHMHGAWWPKDELYALYPKASADNFGAPWERHVYAEGYGIRYFDADSKDKERRDRQDDGMRWVETVEWYEVKDRALIDRELSLQFSTQTGAQVGDTLSPEMLREVRRWYQEVSGEEMRPSMWRETQGRVYYVARVLGDEVLMADETPVGCFTHEALTGYMTYTGDEWRPEGLVEQLKDRQRLENATFSAMIRMLQINPKGTLLVEDGFFKTPNDAMSQWSSPGGVVRVQRGKLTSGADPYRQLPGISMPSFSMAEAIMGIAKNAVTEGAGFNPAALGQLGGDLRRISGTVTSFVNEAATASNSEAFDNFSLYRRRSGRSMLAFLSTYYEPQDLVDMVGEDLAYVTDEMGMPMMDETGQPVLRIPPKEMWKADAWKAIAVQEAVPSPDRQAALWESLAESGGLQLLVETGLFDPEIIAEIIPGVTEPVRDKLKAKAQMITAMQQQQQQQQQPEQQGGGMPPEQQEG